MHLQAWSKCNFISSNAWFLATSSRLSPVFGCWYHQWCYTCYKDGSFCLSVFHHHSLSLLCINMQWLCDRVFGLWPYFMPCNCGDITMTYKGSSNTRLLSHWKFSAKYTIQFLHDNIHSKYAIRRKMRIPFFNPSSSMFAVWYFLFEVRMQAVNSGSLLEGITAMITLELELKVYFAL